jgi:hypothetical protein
LQRLDLAGGVIDKETRKEPLAVDAANYDVELRFANVHVGLLPPPERTRGCIRKGCRRRVSDSKDCEIAPIWSATSKLSRDGVRGSQSCCEWLVGSDDIGRLDFSSRSKGRGLASFIVDRIGSTLQYGIDGAEKEISPDSRHCGDPDCPLRAGPKLPIQSMIVTFSLRYKRKDANGYWKHRDTTQR